MAIEPNYIYYNKRITESLLGNPVNLSANLSREAILFHQLNEKAVSLKSALGLLENTISFYKKPDPIYQVTESFSLTNDLRESLLQADQSVYVKDSQSSGSSLSHVTAFQNINSRELSYKDKNIVEEPNKVSAAVFINGLEKAFDFWTSDPAKGGIAPSGQKERTIVTKYQQKLKTLELEWASINENGENTQWYKDLYAIPGDFIKEIEALQKSIHEIITEIMSLEGKKPTVEEIETLQEKVGAFETIPASVNEDLVKLIGKKVTVELLKPINEQMIAFGKKEYPNVNKISVFWQDLMGVYQEMLAATYPGVEDLTEKISDNVECIDKSRDCIGKINNFVTLLKDFLTVAWTQPGKEDSFYGNARYGSLVNNYMLMGDVLKLLSDGITNDENSKWPDEVQKVLKEFLNAAGSSDGKFSIARTKENANISWSKFMGALFAYYACVRGTASTNSKHSNELDAEVKYWKNHNENQFAKFVLQGVEEANNAYLSMVGQNNNSGKFMSLSYFGVRVFDETTTAEGDKINPRFLQQLMDLVKNDTTINWGGFQAIKDAGDKAVAEIEAEIKKKEAENVNFLKQKDQLVPSAMNYAESMLEYQKAFISTSPLQTSYVSLLLDKYFPEQNHVLKLIGGQMVFSNRAAKDLNKIIQDITMFQASDVYYSLSLYLRQMNLQVVDNAKGKAEAVRDKEFERTQADLTRCYYIDKKIGEIIEEVKKISGEDDPDPVKRKEFLYKLYQYKNQVASLRQNLCNLKVFLQGMTFEDVPEPGATDKAFKVSIYGEPSETWLRQLATLESFVVEGGNKGEVPGGEQQFLKSVEAEEQNYTTFNQNQQLALQMETSAIQQEWTIVTTGLSLLNQIFSKIIRRIKS
ncbi:CT620/CT621 family type III secretion system effector [Chlamydiifrater phoenicopteri]|uniref:CT620/CT621 family type III secretion system effector n=1 Tax=Chlamydiifrater phoenicopteri TaxID=2681469 RepID=UPI001BCF80A7|nr:CT620/CT621 family type III secretion system effector [Chlamydiifrater phoenicopteri]